MTANGQKPTKKSPAEAGLCVVNNLHISQMLFSVSIGGEDIRRDYAARVPRTPGASFFQVCLFVAVRIRIGVNDEGTTVLIQYTQAARRQSNPVGRMYE